MLTMNKAKFICIAFSSKTDNIVKSLMLKNYRHGFSPVKMFQFWLEINKISKNTTKRSDSTGRNLLLNSFYQCLIKCRLKKYKS